MNRLLLLILFILCSTACHHSDTNQIVPVNTDWWKPKSGISFDWDLNKVSITDTFSTDVVDVDAFETTAEVIAALHAKGKKVIAYLSIGTIEKNRPDSSLLPPEIIGNIYPQWPNERWLDVRQLDKMKPWLVSRFDMIKKKGFDAIEPDNLDGYNNNSGFDIKITDTKKLCDYIIDLAHTSGLGIGQKNVPDLTIDYNDKFDWALTEDAFFQGWQDQMIPYINKSKPVFSTEYTDSTSQKAFKDTIYPLAVTLKYYSILKNRGLDKWTYFCK